MRAAVQLPPDPATTEQRRARRHPLLLPATLTHGKITQPVMLQNVSDSGVFLRTEVPPPLRQLLQLRLRHPMDGTELVLHGMAVRVVPADADHGLPAGVGVQLYGLDPDAWDAWHSLVQVLHQNPQRLRAALREELSREQVAPSVPRRSHPRVRVAAEVLIEAEDVVEAMLTGDLSEGGFFVETEVPLPVGSVVTAYLLLPGLGERLALQACVQRQGQGSSGAGMGLRFGQLTNGQRQALQHLLNLLREQAAEA